MDFTNTVLVIIALLVVIVGLAIKLSNEIDKLESEIVNLNYQRQLDNGTLEFKDILESIEVQNEEN